MTQEAQALETMIHSVLAELGPDVVPTLIAHPDAVRGALAAVAQIFAGDEANTLGHEVERLDAIKGSRASPEAVKRGLARRTVAYEPEEEVLGSSAVAARIGLKSRQAVHDRLRKGTIVGWQAAKRGYVFPTRQFDERNRAIKGVSEVVALLGDAYEGWMWLTTPNPAIGGEEPLRWLAQGERERVIGAAHSYLQGDFV